MNSYNHQIANRLLHDELKMINNTSQPEMLYNELDGLNALHNSIMYGGGRPSKYIQSGNSIQSSEPRTLSVGRDPFENVPMHLVETGGNIRKTRGRPSKEEGGNIFDTIGTVAKTATKFAPLLMAAGLEKKKRGRPKKEGGSFMSTLKSVGRNITPIAQQIAVPLAQRALTNYMTGTSVGAGLKKRGRPRKTDGGKFNFLGTLKKVGKTVAPIAQQVGTKVILPVATQALMNYAVAGAGLKKRGRPRKTDGGKFNFLGTLKSVGKTVAPIAQQVGTKVILPVATQALTNYAMSSGGGLVKVKRTRQTGGKFNFLGTLKSAGKTLAPIAQQVAIPVAQTMAKQALTNYMSGSTGAGLKKTTQRGQLIKKVMAEEGCNLGQASKYIKAHGLM